jgi:pimeloyl-ACP methyl ester carboxylesterase
MNKKIVGILIVSISQFIFGSDFDRHVKTEQPTTLFCHGLGCAGKTEDQFYVRRGLMQKPACRIDFDARKRCLGQADDIELLHDKIKELDAEQKKVILFAKSCGAATALNTLGKYSCNNVVGLVLDSAPADMVAVISDQQRTFGVDLVWGRSVKEWFLRWPFPGYPKDSTPPFRAAADIANKDVSVLILHSDQDGLVDKRSSWKNYKALKKAAIDVYLCQLEKGDHAVIVSGPDKKMYAQALHSWYKKNGFAHDSDLSTVDLQRLQPTIDEIDQKFRLDQQEYQRKKLRNLSLLFPVAFMLAGLTQSS